MSSEILQQYSDIVVINADNLALRMGLKIQDLGITKQKESFGGNKDSGYLYLFDSEEFPDAIYECIVSTVGGDAVTSLYKPNRIFGSVGELIRARIRLIEAIAASVGIDRHNVSVDDEGRGRALFLEELSTGQLVDMLAGRMGKSIVVSNSYSAAGLGGITV